MIHGAEPGHSTAAFTTGRQGMFEPLPQGTGKELGFDPTASNLFSANGATTQQGLMLRMLHGVAEQEPVSRPHQGTGDEQHAGLAPSLRQPDDFAALCVDQFPRRQAAKAGPGHRTSADTCTACLMGTRQFLRWHGTGRDTELPERSHL